MFKKITQLLLYLLFGLFGNLILSSNTFGLEVPSKPESGAYVRDDAEILSTEEEAILNKKIKDFTLETSNQIGVLTIKSLKGEEINSYSVRVGREWGIGVKDYNNGVLMLVALEERKIYIAVGTGLEGAIIDSKAASISRNIIAPEFKKGAYFNGISLGLDTIMSLSAAEFKNLALENKLNTKRVDPGRSEFLAKLVVLAYVTAGMLLRHLAKTKSWWLGGLVGAGSAGLISTLIWGFLATGLISAIIFGIVGSIIDLYVSRIYKKKKAAGVKDIDMPWYVGGPNSGSKGRFFGGGGGGSFGGGSFGGGGGGSSW
jgi:uncharacterized protein